MREYLRAIRVYLYTGTMPASYTLGLIEAMMTGTPVVAWNGYPVWNMAGASDLLESDIAYFSAGDAKYLNGSLRAFLNDHALAKQVGGIMRQRAIDLFGIEAVTAQWRTYLGARVAVAA
jgi:glycosyltransferase involved in cell wall biosynthesis